jgi:P-type Ca2+ transporter type 2C
MEWYQKSVAEVLEYFAVQATVGLSESDVEMRRKKYGSNELKQTGKKSLFVIFLSQFQNALIYVLLAAAVLIFFVSDKTIDAFIVSGIVFFNAILGTVQEARAEHILESLKQLMKTKVLVLRNADKIVVSETELVPGDIIFLKEGEKIPADARIIQQTSLGVDESLLTGEQEIVYKSKEKMIETVPVYVRKNIVFKGTTVLSGTAKAIVVATGDQTEIGKLHKTVTEIKVDTPLKEALDKLSVLILVFIATICLSLFLLGLWTAKPIKELLTLIVALFICVIPEGLPLVLTLVLVSGARKLSKHQVLVRNMQAVETLGHVSALVIDKTGTITKNELMVTDIYADETHYTVSGNGYAPQGEVFDDREQKVEKNEQHIQLFLTARIIASMIDVEIVREKGKEKYTIRGDQTAAALKVFAQKLLDKQDSADFEKIDEVPFQSDLQFHAVLIEYDGERYHYMIGSPELVFSRCESVTPFFHNSLQRMLNIGSRSIAIAIKKVGIQTKSIDQAEKDFSLVALVGMQDTIRTEIKHIIERARNAGIAIIMATGDHAVTAKLIASEVSIYKEGDNMIDGVDFAQMSEENLDAAITQTTLFSRMLPEYKMRIITALRKQGHVVAMTGDGVNDAPALVYADIGIAMGSGTEVAKDASDVVLLDDSFQYIIRAIVIGKHIFITLQRVILYFFATNLGELCIIIFAFLFEVFFSVQLPLPITAAQILWLNFVTDGFLDVGLSLEPEEPGLLQKKLVSQQHLLSLKTMWISVYTAVIMGSFSLMLFLFHTQFSLAYAQTVTLITMAMFQWFNAWNCRSIDRSLFSIGLLSNKPLIGITLFVFVLQLCIVYIPGLQYIFDAQPLRFLDWIYITLIASSIIFFEEMRKFVSKRWIKN